ncbi:MAG: ABC transporter permease [Christensenellales bacterium]|jgi:peptide/nickel transport system permease protein
MNTEHNIHDNEHNTLSDEQRVKVLSPSMLVFKRFVRNKLAITGFVILVLMFSFSFIGGLVSPYHQSEVFKKYEYTLKDYAGATINNEIRYVTRADSSFDGAAYARFIRALNEGAETFEAGGSAFSYEVLGDDLAYRITELSEIATVGGKKGLYRFTQTGDVALTPELEQAFTDAALADEHAFVHEGVRYLIVPKDNVTTSISVEHDTAIASTHIFDAYSASDKSTIDSYAFHVAAEHAIAAGDHEFELDGHLYTLSGDEDSTIIYQDGREFAGITDLIVNAIAPDVFITVDFKQAFRDAIDAGASEFTILDDAGEETHFSFSLVASQYTISTNMLTLLNDSYAFPSAAHPLGTDSNGMDVLTRLMYGGRVSLSVGFVVVLIELFIGIIIGGVSGYFGGWVDTLLMRFVDLFYCIPYWPMMIIAGSVMETLEFGSYTRIFLLMFIMGLLGWTGIARVVRGQILSLREQDFMIATEATGIRVSRRIFRHLVPNVMPLLIVQATMALGSIIILEATLSFLGLGVKYPLASWGSIINAATDIYVMKAHWFIWIPAGVLILLTVLGFNFVGDGLRDAFDPKMKR